MRPLLLDDALPAGLVVELRARGRAASAVAPSVSDQRAVEDAAERDAVLVTTFDGAWPPHPPAAVAIVVGRTLEARRDVVHRWAHAMAVQRVGTVRRYR